MIKLDFSKGNLAAHEQLVEIIIFCYLKQTRAVGQNIEYKKGKEKLTAGEIDVIATYNDSVHIVEVKTNNDLDLAVEELKNHYKNSAVILSELPLKFSANVRKIRYFAIIYELYSVYELNPENNEVLHVGTMDDFLNNP